MKRRNHLLRLCLSSSLLFLFSACEEEITPTACFTTPQDTYFVGETVRFENCSKDATFYSWDLGNSTTSLEFNPAIAYETPGQYTVRLVASNEDKQNFIDKVITVNPYPDAVPCFEWDEPVYANVPVTMTNCSQEATSYVWTWDGVINPIISSQMETDAVFRFPYAGTYTIVLTATGVTGPVTIEKTVTVLESASAVSSCGEVLSSIQKINSGYKAIKTSDAGAHIVTLDQDFQEISSKSYDIVNPPYSGLLALENGADIIFSNTAFRYPVGPRDATGFISKLIFTDVDGSVLQEYSFDEQVSKVSNQIFNVMRHGSEIYVIRQRTDSQASIYTKSIQIFSPDGILQEDISLNSSLSVYKVFRMPDDDWMFYGEGFVSRYSSKGNGWYNSFPITNDPYSTPGSQPASPPWINSGVFDDEGNVYVQTGRDFYMMGHDGTRNLLSSPIEFAKRAGVRVGNVWVISDQPARIDYFTDHGVSGYNEAGEKVFTTKTGIPELVADENGNLAVFEQRRCGSTGEIQMFLMKLDEEGNAIIE